MLTAQLTAVKQQVLENDHRVLAHAMRREPGRRLMGSLSVGKPLVSTFIASVEDAAVFKTDLDLAACIGLVPKQSPSDGQVSLPPALLADLPNDIVKDDIGG